VPFFKRDDDGDAGDQQQPQQPDYEPDQGDQEIGEGTQAQAYAAGSLEGLPDSGRNRIARMKQDIARGFFTSDLSVNEFLLVKEAGFEPLGLVLGSSIYHIGFQQAMWNRSQEMGVLTGAMYHARELAMTRMEEEADELGADGVVGVRLTIGRYAWGADMAEFVAVGTAVKHREGALHRTLDGRPFTSDLNGQDFSTLLRAGYRPVGLVMGNCVYHVAHQTMRQTWRQMGRNQEMTNFTQALYEARELAMGRMQAEAERLEAGGLVGVAWVGLARDRVLLDRDGGDPDEDRPHHREASVGAPAHRLTAMPDVELKPQVYKDSRPPEEFIHFHERVRDHPPEWIYEVVRVLTVTLAVTAFRARGYESQRVPAGKLILAPNHASFMDHFFSAAFIRRHVQFMAKSQLFANPVMSWIFSHGGVFPVLRGRADEDAFKTAFAVLDRGGVVGMYVEGGR
jgi:uncharacterized protein YbjQ (UPF0145 family)